MDIAKAFTFVFEDEKWLSKIIIGGILLLFSFLIIPALIILGYMVEIIARVTRGQEPALPEWEDFGKLLADGFMLVVIYIIYTIPIYALLALSAIIGGSLNALSGNGGILSNIGAFVVLIASLLALAYAVFLVLIVPAITTKYALTLSFSQTFNLREIWNFTRDNFGNVLLVILLAYLANVIGSLGTIVFIIGAVFTYAYAVMVTANLYGQLGKYWEPEKPKAAAA